MATRRKRTKLTPEQERLVARINATSELLSEFGVTAAAYDPGVQGYLDDPDRGSQLIDIDGATWRWLKPLLEELRGYRHGT
jgi:hypothetical protein